MQFNSTSCCISVVTEISLVLNPCSSKPILVVNPCSANHTWFVNIKSFSSHATLSYRVLDQK